MENITKTQEIKDYIERNEHFETGIGKKRIISLPTALLDKNGLNLDLTKTHKFFFHYYEGFIFLVPMETKLVPFASTSKNPIEDPDFTDINFDLMDNLFKEFNQEIQAVHNDEPHLKLEVLDFDLYEGLTPAEINKRTSTLTKAKQISIPKVICDTYDLQEGDVISIARINNVLAFCKTDYGDGKVSLIIKI